MKELVVPKMLPTKVSLLDDPGLLRHREYFGLSRLINLLIYLFSFICGIRQARKVALQKAQPQKRIESLEATVKRLVEGYNELKAENRRNS